MLDSTETAVPSGLVNQYYEGLRRGRIVDVLDVFSTDAILQDERGRVHQGIREIAAAFAREKQGGKVELLDIDAVGGEVTAIVQVRGPPRRAPREYRQVFRFRGRRVQSLRIEPLTR